MTAGARFTNVNIPSPLTVGEMGCFDYQTLSVNYGNVINGIAEEKWDEDTDGTATILLSEGLTWHEYDGERQYRCITACKFREETNGKDTVYMYIPSESTPGYKRYTLPVTVRKTE